MRIEVAFSRGPDYFRQQLSPGRGARRARRRAGQPRRALVAGGARHDALVTGGLRGQPGRAPGDGVDAARGLSLQWRVLEQWLAEESEWDRPWVDAAIASDCALEMTPENLKAMSEEIWEVVQRYRYLPKPEGQETRCRPPRRCGAF